MAGPFFSFQDCLRYHGTTLSRHLAGKTNVLRRSHPPPYKEVRCNPFCHYNRNSSLDVPVNGCRTMFMRSHNLCLGSKRNTTNTSLQLYHTGILLVHGTKVYRNDIPHKRSHHISPSRSIAILVKVKSIKCKQFYQTTVQRSKGITSFPTSSVQPQG